MKHFIDPKTEEIFAYESDGSQDSFIKSGLIPLTDEDLIKLRAPTSAQLWAMHQSEASLALAKSDMVALRCFKVAVPFPVAWQTYVTALRAIVATTTGDPTKPLPTMPAYPAGT